MPDEQTPLLWDSSMLSDPHQQFCRLSGVPPSNVKVDKKHPFVVGPKTLYGRTTNAYASARRSYSFMSGLNNTLLLSQVILGATLTALGASESSHILITCFGVMNTVIAGLVAYMKSRGQPARARLYRDDLEMVLNQIEDSEIMWLGIAQNIHGYDEIDIDDKVTVRSEVARLMRLYDKARKSFILSNPDNYLMGQSDNSATALKSRAGIGGGFPPAPPVTLPVMTPVPPAPVAGPSTAPPANSPPVLPPVEEGDPDESPATAPVKPTKDSTTPPADEKEKSAGTDKPVPANNSSSSSTKPQDALKDDPPSYNNSQDASKETPKTVPVNDETPEAVPAKETPQASTPAAAAPSPAQPQPPPMPAPEADPDESPATAVRGFERSRSRSDEEGKSAKGKGKDNNSKS